MNSIRARLLLWQLSAVLVTAVMVSALTYHLALEGFNEVQDYGLEQIAHTVLRHDETPVPVARPKTSTPSATDAMASGHADTDTDAGEEMVTEPASDEPDEGQFVSQIWSAKGALVYASAIDDGPPLQPPGFHLVNWGDHTWRVYTLPRETRTVQVAVTRHDRNHNFLPLVVWLLLPLGLLVLLLSLLIHQAVSRALRPLHRLQRDLGQREVAELHAVSLNDLPDEVMPLASTLNQLLERVDKLLAGQRQFLADAAHELNTPLAAIKLQAQLARRAQDAERAAALDALDAGIERAIHLAAQLLQLARLEPDRRRPAFADIPMDTLVRHAVVACSAAAEQRGIDLGLEHTEALTVHGDHVALRAMLDNRIDNSLRYTPSGARVDVSLRRHEDHAVLEVIDNGPGIAAADRERAVQRFVRLNPGSARGSGLGLAIASETATLHDGLLLLDETPGGGLTVRVRLPLSAVTASPATAGD